MSMLPMLFRGSLHEHASCAAALRKLSTKAASRATQAEDTSLWASIRRAIFPVPASNTQQAQSAAQAAAQSATRVQSGASAGTSYRTPGSKLAAAAARARRGRAAAETAENDEHFQSLSREGEHLVGNLFKAGMVFITLPLAGYIISDNLLVGQITSGLKSKESKLVKLGVQRLPSYLFCEYLVNKFEEADGVASLVSHIGRDLPPGMVPDMLQALRHLSQYEQALNSLLMARAVERLEEALQGGWLPREQLEDVKQLYLDLHAARRSYVEKTYGAVTDPRVAKPIAL